MNGAYDGGVLVAGEIGGDSVLEVDGTGYYVILGWIRWAMV